MAGHNKWSKIKRSKGVLDVKRGMLFSKLSKELTVAAKIGGGNPDLNPRLRAAIDSAKAQSMPGDRIDRAIKKATGELSAAAVEEITYEGYAPGGVAILVETATDNRNRTAADVRSIFTKNHGNLGGPGSVAYQFRRIGQITLSADSVAEDALLEMILDAGADDLESDESTHTVTTPPDKLYAVADALRTSGLAPTDEKLTYLPDTPVMVTDPAIARQVLRLCDAFEANDDVLAVHSNFDMPEELLLAAQEA